MRTRVVYQCEACKYDHASPDSIFFCIHCNKEICEACFYSYQTCKDCAGTMTITQMELAYENHERKNQ